MTPKMREDYPCKRGPYTDRMSRRQMCRRITIGQSGRADSYSHGHSYASGAAAGSAGYGRPQRHLPQAQWRGRRRCGAVAAVAGALLAERECVSGGVCRHRWRIAVRNVATSTSDYGPRRAVMADCGQDLNDGKSPLMPLPQGIKIRNIHVRDIRFPTSLRADGSDAMHTDPDYSCAYVVIYTDKEVEGHGLTFTLGRGTEIVVQAVKTLARLVVGQEVADIFHNFGAFWRKLTSESQLRWIGPEKGVVHLATAAIVNALWDLWACLEHKPLWKLLVDLEPEELVSAIDFRYISDVVTKEEAIEMLKAKKAGKEKREEEIRVTGYPAYTTQVGWLGYSTEKVRQLCHEYLAAGFTSFKVKVGQNLEDDRKRCRIVREVIGYEKKMMVDANQTWDVTQSIEWMKQLAEFKPVWIEEPTSPDDVLGHLAISKALKPLGIGVATGEMCCNRVLFKQFLQSGAMQFCQIDSCRIGGVNEILSVYLMAQKLGVPVCPHAGGVGLCEMVQHLQIFDYIALSGTMEGRMIEFVDQQHEHFENPTVIKHAHYVVPTAPGYSTKMKPSSAEAYEYPIGSKWQEMFAEGIFKDPAKESALN